ncbi:MAG TPA: hypothetical protein VJ250_03625 [Nitrososphaeraceae archaeon]|nr:hypothetical protein [Nitrososphaeraceae archaeon]
MNVHNCDSDSEKSLLDSSIQRVGDITQESATNEAVDTDEASKIASLLQGITFPATKEQIKEYIADSKSISASNENVINISQFIENNLPEGKEYNSVYEIEKSLGLVVKKNDGKYEQIIKKEIDEDMNSYARDKAFNEANRRRYGENARSDPYSTGET